MKIKVNMLQQSKLDAKSIFIIKALKANNNLHQYF